MNKTGYVYLLTNKSNTTIYTGVTNNLKKRIFQHKNKLVDGFSKKYNLDKLVYFECANDFFAALEREKQIKAGTRKKKLTLIKNFNPEFKDLYSEL